MSNDDLRQIKRLVTRLESSDAFDRRDAIEQLAILTQQRLDFRWCAGDGDRVRAVRRWRRWVAHEERNRRGRRTQATIQILAGTEIDKAALEEAFKDLPAAHKKALMAKVIAKVAAEQAGLVQGALPACQQCERRPATASVTVLTDDGSYTHRRLCEVCAHRSGG